MAREIQRGRALFLLRNLLWMESDREKLGPESLAYLARIAEEIGVPPDQLRQLVDQRMRATEAVPVVWLPVDARDFLPAMIDAAYADGWIGPSEVRTLRAAAQGMSVTGAAFDRMLESAGLERHIAKPPTTPAMHSGPPLTSLFPADAQLSLLFTDIKGSVTLFEKLGDTEARRLEDGVERTLGECIRSSSGHLIERVGDALFAAFLDPVRAVACALEMQESLQKWRVESGLKRDPAVRIAVHHGPVIVEERHLVGTTVNVAARIMHEADADEVVISDPLHRLAPESLASRFRSIGPVLPRGSGKVVELMRWRAPWKAVAAAESAAAMTGLGATVSAEGPLAEPDWVLEPKSDRYTLVGMSQENQGTRVVLGGDLMVLGRNLGCEIRVTSEMVSRKHAGFLVLRRQCWVFDLGGKGGVMVCYPTANTKLRGIAERAPLPVGTVLTTGPIAWQIEG